MSPQVVGRFCREGSRGVFCQHEAGFYLHPEIDFTPPLASYGGSVSVHLEELGRKAFRRNPLIAELFYRIGKGEKLGSGITRIKALMDEWRLKAPVFDVSGGFFSITFIGPRTPVAEEKLALLPARLRRFVESRNQIEEPFVAAAYAEMLHVTRRTAQKDLDVLIKGGVIRKEGQGKNTRYRFC